VFGGADCEEVGRAELTMRESIKSQYSVTGSIGKEDITTHAIPDRKNNSIHIHFYGKLFGDTPKTILVKHAVTKFPEAEGVDLAKQIVIGEFTNKQVQIKRVTKKKGTPVEQTKAPQRTIIRFKA